MSVLERLMHDELPCSARAAASLYREVAMLSRRGGGRSEESAAWRGRGMVTLPREEAALAKGP